MDYIKHISLSCCLTVVSLSSEFILFLDICHANLLISCYDFSSFLAHTFAHCPIKICENSIMFGPPTPHVPITGL